MITTNQTFDQVCRAYVARHKASHATPFDASVETYVPRRMRKEL